MTSTFTRPDMWLGDHPGEDEFWLDELEDSGWFDMNPACWTCGETIGPDQPIHEVIVRNFDSPCSDSEETLCDTCFWTCPECGKPVTCAHKQW